MNCDELKGRNRWKCDIFITLSFILKVLALVIQGDDPLLHIFILQIKAF